MKKFAKSLDFLTIFGLAEKFWEQWRSHNEQSQTAKNIWLVQQAAYGLGKLLLSSKLKKYYLETHIFKKLPRKNHVGEKSSNSFFGKFLFRLLPKSMKKLYW